MERFRFRLERVLSWYGTQYLLEENRLAGCIFALKQADDAIAQLQTERSTIERELVHSNAIAAQDLAALGLYRLGAKRQELELTVERGERENAVRAQQERLNAIRQRQRLLEKLRERRLSEYTYEAARELESLASDAYLAKWSHT